MASPSKFLSTPTCTVLEEFLAHLNGVILHVLETIDITLVVVADRLGREHRYDRLLVAPEGVLTEHIVGEGDRQARGQFDVDATSYLQIPIG